jgi:hypothetical protein
MPENGIVVRTGPLVGHPSRLPLGRPDAGHDVGEQHDELFVAAAWFGVEDEQDLAGVGVYREGFVVQGDETDEEIFVPLAAAGTRAAARRRRSGDGDVVAGAPVAVAGPVSDFPSLRYAALIPGTHGAIRPG